MAQKSTVEPASAIAAPSEPILQRAGQPNIRKAIMFMIRGHFTGIDMNEDYYEYATLKNENELVRASVKRIIRVWWLIFKADVLRKWEKLDPELALLEYRHYQGIVNAACEDIEEMMDLIQDITGDGSCHNPAVMRTAERMRNIAKILLVRYNQREIVKKEIGRRVDKIPDYCVTLLRRKGSSPSPPS